MADPIQSRAREKRRAEALRANLKRRKEQARERDGDAAEGGDTKAAIEDAGAVSRNEQNK